jgi:two-component system chemotaxis response regulator CheY
MLNILIVDDSRTMRRLVRRALENIGLGGQHIDECSDGQEAWDYLTAEDRRVDLVLLDWSMPTMAGIDLLMRLNRQGMLEHTRVIMVTSMSDDMDIEEAYEEGASAFVAKPFTEDEMREALQKALPHYTGWKGQGV